MNIPKKLTKEEARARLTAIDADPDAIDWGNVRAELAGAEAEAAAHPDLVKGLPVEKTLTILRAHVAYLNAASETDGGDVTYIVWTAPEPEAGLPGDRAEVSMFVAADDDASVRKGLAETFAWIWGLNARHVHVEVATERPADRRRLGRQPTAKLTTECARPARSCSPPRTTPWRRSSASRRSWWPTATPTSAKTSPCRCRSSAGRCAARSA